MKALRLLAVPAVGLLIYSSAARAADLEGGDQAGVQAAEGLQQLGSLLNYVADPAEELGSRIDATVSFVKKLLASFAPEAVVEQLSSSYANKMIELIKARAVTLNEMDQIAEKIDAGVSPEEEEALRTRMREMIEKFKEIVAHGLVKTFQETGAGLPEDDEAEKDKDSLIFQLAELSEILTLKKYYPYT